MWNAPRSGLLANAAYSSVYIAGLFPELTPKDDHFRLDAGNCESASLMQLLCLPKPRLDFSITIHIRCFIMFICIIMSGSGEDALAAGF